MTPALKQDAFECQQSARCKSFVSLYCYWQPRMPAVNKASGVWFHCTSESLQTSSGKSGGSARFSMGREIILSWVVVIAAGVMLTFWTLKLPCEVVHQGEGVLLAFCFCRFWGTLWGQCRDHRFLHSPDRRWHTVRGGYLVGEVLHPSTPHYMGVLQNHGPEVLNTVWMILPCGNTKLTAIYQRSWFVSDNMYADIWLSLCGIIEWLQKAI